MAAETWGEIHNGQQGTTEGIDPFDPEVTGPLLFSFFLVWRPRGGQWGLMILVPSVYATQSMNLP